MDIAAFPYTPVPFTKTKGIHTFGVDIDEPIAMDFLIPMKPKG